MARNGITRPEGHGTQVEYVPYVPHTGGVPFRATCWCGWKSRTVATYVRAEAIAADHIEHPAQPRRTVLV